MSTVEKCTRCSMATSHPTRQLCLRCFDERAKVVYWDREPACNARGPNKAQCLLEVGHLEGHEGNGYDDYGPLFRSWRTKAKRPRRTMTPEDTSAGRGIRR